MFNIPWLGKIKIGPQTHICKTLVYVPYCSVRMPSHTLPWANWWRLSWGSESPVKYYKIDMRL